MAEFLFWCLVAASVLLASFVLGMAFMACLIADDCDQHARHIEECEQ